MTPPTPNKCKIKCDMFTCICADGSEAHDPPTQKEPECIEGLREDRTLRFGTTITRMGVVDILAAYDALKANLDAAEKDAARYQWLKARLLGVDWAFGDPSESVMLFTIPNTMRVSGNLDATLDTARTAATAQGGTA